jgi:hypothetical protein
MDMNTRGWSSGQGYWTVRIVVAWRCETEDAGVERSSKMTVFIYLIFIFVSLKCSDVGSNICRPVFLELYIISLFQNLPVVV